MPLRCGGPRRRLPALLAAVPALLAACAGGSSTAGGSKKCAGSYISPVVNLCTAHWPDAKSTRVWLVVFYTTWWGHCRALEPKFQELGRALKNDKAVGIGAIDCDKDRAICSKYGVSGYPTIKAIVGGKGKSYNGARETEAMKEWITKTASNRGTKGGSAKCPLGAFKSKVKDAVVPLCEEHFPDEKAKNQWIIVFYSQKELGDLKNELNTVAKELGNDPPDMSSSLKKPKKRRERLGELAKAHGLALNLPAKGPFGMDALAKVGAVCCDCGEEAAAFCASALRQGEEDLAPPQAFWVAQGKRTLVKVSAMTARDLAGAAVERLGFLKSGSAASGEL